MSHVTKLIKTEQGYYNFYFNKIYTVDGARYHISVIAKDSRSYTLQLEELNGQWTIINPGNCPYWMIGLENEYNSAIAENS